MPPKCDATCFVHWNGVLPACAQPIEKCGKYRPAPLVDVRELRRRFADDAVERQHLVVGAVRAAFGARAVVADDVEEERVVELAHVLERLNQPADLVVGVLPEAGEGLHLAREQRFWSADSESQAGISAGRAVSFVPGRHDAELDLPRERLLAQLVPALIELALVFAMYSFGAWCGACVAPVAKYM